MATKQEELQFLTFPKDLVTQYGGLCLVAIDVAYDEPLVFIDLRTFDKRAFD